MPAPIMTARDDSVARRKMPTGVVRMVGSKTARISVSWARRKSTLAGARKRTSFDHATGLAVGPGAGVAWDPMTDVDTVARLQHMVDGFSADVEAVQVGLADARTPEGGRRALGAALIYVVDRFDLMPDHIPGLGVADDAAVLRLAAKIAVSYGADDAGLRRLAGEAAHLSAVFDDLLGPLEDYLNRLQWHAAPGKTPADVIDDPETRVQL